MTQKKIVELMEEKMIKIKMNETQEQFVKLTMDEKIIKMK